MAGAADGRGLGRVIGSGAVATGGCANVTAGRAHDVGTADRGRVGFVCLGGAADGQGVGRVLRRRGWQAVLRARVLPRRAFNAFTGWRAFLALNGGPADIIIGAETATPFLPQAVQARQRKARGRVFPGRDSAHDDLSCKTVAVTR